MHLFKFPFSNGKKGKKKCIYSKTTLKILFDIPLIIIQKLILINVNFYDSDS